MATLPRPPSFGPACPRATQPFPHVVEVLANLGIQTPPTCRHALQTHALQRALSKYGIIELARTGKICLKRGEQLLEMGGWGEGQAPPGTRQSQAEALHSQSAAAEAEAGLPGAPAEQAAQPRRAEGNDVYVDSDDGAAGLPLHPRRVVTLPGPPGGSVLGLLRRSMALIL